MHSEEGTVTRRRSLLALVGSALVLGCASRPPAGPAAPGAGSGPSLAGSYSALSDWPLVVELRENGRARIEYGWWDGKVDALHSMRAHWRVEGNEIVLSYGSVIDRLRYDPKLSLKAAGRRGRRPGLRALEPIHRKSLIGSASLWSQDPAR